MKVPPALAAGNSVTIKPPETTPFTALRFAELGLKAGIPPGVVNVVPGGIEAGEALVTHPGVDKISFTGGTPTAQRIMAAAAKNLTPVMFEPGGERLGGDLASGNFVPPTIFVNPDPRSKLAQNEAFGPVTAVFRFKTEEEAIALTNSTTWGLASYVQTANLQRARRGEIAFGSRAYEWRAQCALRPHIRRCRHEWLRTRRWQGRTQ